MPDDERNLILARIQAAFRRGELPASDDIQGVGALSATDLDLPTGWIHPVPCEAFVVGVGTNGMLTPCGRDAIGGTRCPEHRDAHERKAGSDPLVAALTARALRPLPRAW